MANEVFQTTGPYGVVVYGKPWAYNPTEYTIPDGRKYTGRLDAVATNYGEITLSWTLPVGTGIDRFAVVRATFGAPRSRYSGSTIIDAAADGPVRSVIDAGLTVSRWYYYSLYVRESATGRWILAGTAQQISVQNWAHQADMMGSLPRFYRVMDREMTGSVESGHLYRFLKIFSFEMDLLRTLGKTVEQLRAMPDVGAQMLEPFSNDFGLNYETVFGDAKMRGILDRIVKWRKGKGSVETLTEIVRTLSACSDGYVETVPNILLDHNASGFDEPTVGRWSNHTNATITRTTTSPPGPRSSVGYLRVEATNAGDVKIASCPANKIKTQGVKVNDGDVYTASGYVRAATSARTVSAEIEWYDNTGTLIVDFYQPLNLNSQGPFSEVPYSSFWWKSPDGPAPYGGTAPGGAGEDVLAGIDTPAVDSNANWNARFVFTQQAPPGAKFARMVITVTGPADNEVHYFDELQFELGAEVTEYEPARKVKVYACGDRKNVVANPSFEDDVRNWAAINTDLVLGSTPPLFGSSSLGVSPLNPGPVSVSTVGTVSDSKYYTFSAYLQPLEMPTPCVLTIEWMNADNEVLRVSSREQVLTPLYWNRPFVTDVGPAGATKAAFSIVLHPHQGETVAIDAVLAEAGAQLQDYFDGSFGNFDWQWVGEANNSQSIFIANRQVFTEVLGRYLDEFVPATTPWEIMFTA